MKHLPHKSRFAELIEHKYVDWQAKQRKRVSLEEFASLLGYSQATVSQWMADKRKPSPEAILKLGEILGPEVYDAFDLPRPDPLLIFIVSNWGNIPQETQQDIFDQINNYLAKQEEENKKPLRGASETSTA